MIRIKRVYDAPESGDGERILVDRMWPRGLTKERAAIDLWLRDVAPSDELRKWFGHNPERWMEFKEKYHRELRAGSAALETLKVHSRGDVVTLLFAARDEAHNNAVALREYLDGRRQHGVAAEGARPKAPAGLLKGPGAAERAGIAGGGERAGHGHTR